MRVIGKSIYYLLFAIALVVVYSGCEDDIKKQQEIIEFSSYRDIPGITENEIKALEDLRQKHDYFTYGMPLSTEAFINESGGISGFSAATCEWLTELFNIPFRPALYEWDELLDGLNTGKISFSGELTPTDDRRKFYHMTGSIASRPVKTFRIAGSRPLWEIVETRPVRSGFIQNSATISAVTAELEPGTFEIIQIGEFSQIYKELKSGNIDVFYYSGVAEINFIGNNDIIAQEFYPLIYMPVSLSTQDSGLEPVISIVDKALKNGSLHHLTMLYNKAQQEYLRFKLYNQLTEQERAYISSNPYIPIGVDPGNYPGSFYDKRKGEWAGIFIDILNEVSSLTELKFERVNNSDKGWPDIIEMLIDGEISLVPELTQTIDRAGQFLWPSTAQLTDYYALISNNDYPDIKTNEVLYVKVGLAKNTAYTAIFKKWFPDHLNAIEYETMEEAFAALLRGEVDMVMGSQKRLLYLTHYLELPDYKTNIVFDYAINIMIGLNKDETILCSIIDKALGSIDSRSISDYWMRRTYDYRSKVAEARTPWIVGAAILFMCVMGLVAVLLLRSRRASKQLEDLVEKRTYELALQTATLTTLFDSIPDLIFTKNLKLNFLHCNKAFLKHFDKNIDDIVGKSDEDGLGLTHEDADNFNNVDLKVIYEEKTLTIEEHIPCADGTNPYYETIKMPLMLNGEVVGIMGIARNITERKEAERKIEANYEYSKKLSDALSKITKSPTISAGILKEAADAVAQEGCNALNANRVVIWSYLEDENMLESISVYDSHIGENTIPEKYDLSFRHEYLNLLKSERLIIMNDIEECRLISDANGYNHLCAALDAPIRIDGKLIGVVCIEQWSCNEFPDMREWRIEEQNFTSSLADLMSLAISGYERRKARDSAELASQTKSTFLANMSHEIRTPMNAILGVTEILIQHESLPIEFEEGLGKIYSSCDLLLGIINDILDFSKIEAGKLDIMPAQYKVASMINDSVHLNMMRINSKPIEFELQVDKNIPAKLIGDELRIKQILNNLLSNAFKYTDAGKVVLSVGFEPIPLLSYLPDHTMKGQVRWSDVNKKGVTLLINVKDTGHGMTKEQLGKIFDEYSRFNQGKNTTIEGTGLGLAITKRLVNLMNGYMHVESEPDEGTLFTVRLPQETVDNEVLGQEVAENLRQFRTGFISQRQRGQIARDPMPYGNVLIVDDVETNLYVAVGLMKLYRLQIDTATRGHEAIEKAKSGKTYDIIFMDHMMPEMDGIETTKHLRDLGYTAPIIALTANAVAGQADMFLQNGFDEFISKPIDIRQLNSVLNRFVRDKQSQEVIETARKQRKGAGGKAAHHPEVDSILLDSFIRDASKAISWIEENTDLGDNELLRKYTIVVHGIKSSLWNISENSLADLAYKLELAGRERKMETIKTSTPVLLKELRALLEIFESERDKFHESVNTADEDVEELREKLETIKEMCANYDRKGALEIIAEIKKYSKETKAVLDNIRKLVLHSDFEEVENVVQEYTTALSLNQKKDVSQLAGKEVAGLDIAKGLQRYEDDEKTYIKVLRSYVASVRSMLSSIETVNEEKIDQYKIKVHGIKGTSLDIFAEQIGIEAKALEEAAKTGNIDYINKNNPPFLEAAWKLISNIENLLIRLEEENPRPKKDKPDEQILLKLLNACKSYDMDGADAAMAEIEKYKYEADNGLADLLRECIDRMDFKQIVSKLSEGING